MCSGATYFVLKPYNIEEMCENIVGLVKKNRDNVLNKTMSLDIFGIELKVTEILHEIGVPAHIKGYHYLRDSIIMSVEKPEIINAVTKQLYPSVAKNTKLLHQELNVLSDTQLKLPGTEEILMCLIPISDILFTMTEVSQLTANLLL